MYVTVKLSEVVCLSLELVIRLPEFSGNESKTLHVYAKELFMLVWLGLFS